MCQHILNLQVLVGKTIEKIDDSADNQIVITFTDKTSVILHPERLFPSLERYGIVGYENDMLSQ